MSSSSHVARDQLLIEEGMVVADGGCVKLIETNSRNSAVRVQQLIQHAKDEQLREQEICRAQGVQTPLEKGQAKIVEFLSTTFDKDH
jgi:hypothetical protein